MVSLDIIQQGKSEGFDSCDLPSNLTEIGFKSSIFQPCDLEIWLMTSKNYGAPLLHYIKLCASSQTPWWIQTAVALRKRSIRVKISDWLSCMTFKFDGRPWKKNKAPLLCCFKLYASFYNHRWIQTKVTVQKRSIRVTIGDFLSHMTLKFDEWPWKTIGTSSMLLLAYASFRSHWWIQTGVTVRKRPIWVKIDDF